MKLDEKLQNVSVIGAAGKMGSGIAVLIGSEIAKLKVKYPDKIFHLNLIDVSEKGLDGLYKYLKKQVIKVAEKNIVFFRNLYKDKKNLIENSDIINYFTEEVLSVCRFTTDLNAAGNSDIIFEAIVEKIDVKIQVLKQLKDICEKDVIFFTNTSSIPIGLLDEKVGLDGKIIGYHFYNPPVIQRLVEVITNDKTDEELKEIAYELGKRLRKKLVPSNDISGFIGNGHFAHDGLHALEEVEKLSEKFSLPEAIYIMNSISQKFLIRPMGIFQLIDYVGIDVFQAIYIIMREHIPDQDLESDLLDKMMEMGVKGGQNADGTQVDGFLQYKRSKPIGVFDPDKKKYLSLKDEWKKKIDDEIGKLPEGYAPWRAMLTDPDKKSKLARYFKNLRKLDTLGAKLAIKYLEKSKEIGKNLLEMGVAKNKKDVNDVLKNGFYHLYGPINDY